MTAPATEAPVAPVSIDAAIASFIAEGHTPEAPIVPADQAPESPDPEEPVPEAVTEDAAEAAEAEATAPETGGVDQAALAVAIKDEDLPAFLKALGPAADKLLTSKAHKALRLQAKELGKQTASAQAAQKKAEELSGKLAEKYSEPMKVRQAIEGGKPEAVDVFLDYVERTTGAPWNDILKWVAKGFSGRPERLASKAQAETAATTAAETSRVAAVKQAQDWVAAGINKSHPELLKSAPELADLVLEEIKAGYHSGVQTPARALPLALKKLKAQHARLTAALALTEKAKPASAPAVAARANKAPEAPRTTPRNLTEDIEDFLKTNNLGRFRS